MISIYAFSSLSNYGEKTKNKKTLQNHICLWFLFSHILSTGNFYKMVSLFPSASFSIHSLPTSLQRHSLRNNSHQCHRCPPAVPDLLEDTLHQPFFFIKQITLSPKVMTPYFQFFVLALSLCQHHSNTLWSAESFSWSGCHLSAGVHKQTPHESLLVTPTSSTSSSTR